MPLFNTSNPFRSSASSSSSSSSSSSRRGPSRNPSSTQPRPPPPPRQPDPVQTSLEQLERLELKLSTLRRTFRPPHPSDLTFQPPPPSTSTSASSSSSSFDGSPHSATAKLDYTPTNGPVHAFEEALMKLLIELDGVDSCQRDDVRSQRKRLVRDVEREIQRLDEWKKNEYDRRRRTRTTTTTTTTTTNGNPLAR
ncbi:hypothetical protein JCM10212_005053 [Sporobolomyces blumeae]